MKPRLRYIIKFKRWECRVTGRFITGKGETPKEAYENWDYLMNTLASLRVRGAVMPSTDNEGSEGSKPS